MKRISWLVLFVAVLAVVVVASTTRAGITPKEEAKAWAEKREWGEVVNGCQVSIQQIVYKGKQDNAVTLSIIVKNTGKGTVTYYETLDYRDFVLTVEDKDGKEVPLTPAGEKIRSMEDTFRRSIIKLAPGEWEEYSIDASRMHDMTHPGEYTIAATLKIHDAENNKLVPVTSNTITVKAPE